MRDEAIEKLAALAEFGDCDELVGLVRLVDRARSDHHGRDAGRIEQAGLGAKGDLAVAALSAERFRQADHLRVRRHVEAGEAGYYLEIDPGLRRDRFHLRFERTARIARHLAHQAIEAVRRDRAELEFEA